MSTWTKEKMNKVYEDMMAKAATDAEFRSSVLSDPTKAIAEYTGETLPAGLKIKVIESDPAYQATFVLPDMISEEFSDSELDSIAGGSCGAKACGADGCGAQACAGQVSK